MAYLVKKSDKKQSVQNANAAGLVTFEKFYDIVEENVKANLLDGKIIRDSPAIPRHGETCIIIGEKYLEGPPDLCIEVISKSSRKIDRGRKFVLYAEHGVKEYWIVDPLRFTIEFYENQDGEWVEIKPDEHGRLHSKVLSGFWLNAKWFTSVQPLPPVAQALEEILGKERKR
jgi:Uma2 family endonuclease